MDKNMDYTLAGIFGELMNDESWEGDAQMRMSAVYGLAATQVIFAYMPALNN